MYMGPAALLLCLLALLSAAARVTPSGRSHVQTLRGRIQESDTLYDNGSTTLTFALGCTDAGTQCPAGFSKAGVILRAPSGKHTKPVHGVVQGLGEVMLFSFGTADVHDSPMPQQRAGAWTWSAALNASAISRHDGSKPTTVVIKFAGQVDSTSRLELDLWLECAETSVQCQVPQCRQCRSPSVCLECTAGLFLSQSGHSCVETCVNGTTSNHISRKCVPSSSFETAMQLSDNSLPTHLSRERRNSVCSGSVLFSLDGSSNQYTLHTNPGQSQYNNFMSCSWTFTPRPFHSVFIDITEFQTEPAFDTFRVVGGTVDYTASGNATLTPGLLRQFLIPAQTVATFTSDISQVRTGVKANVYWMCSNTTVNVTLPTSGIFFIRSFGTNSDIAIGGVTPTPKYLPFLNCTWILSPPNGYRARVTFEPDFHTEDSYDFVSVYDGANQLAPQLLRASGIGAPPSQTGAAELTVNFNSDRSIQFSGFRAVFSAVAANCPNVTLTNNAVSVLVGTLGAVVSTSCNNGFSIGGGVSRTVSRSYTCTGIAPGVSAWMPSPTATASSCQPVACQSLLPLNAATSSLSAVTGETDVTTCLSGYGLADGSLAGSKTYSCVASSSPGFSDWSPEPRSCISLNCSALSIFNSTSQQLPASTRTASVSITCLNGYSIGGGASTSTSRSYTCSGTAPGVVAWTPSPTAAASSCQPVNCPNVTFTLRPNTTFVMNGTTGVSRFVACSNGFTFQPKSPSGGLFFIFASDYSGTFQCNPTGPGTSAWSTIARTDCLAAYCPEISFKRNGVTDRFVYGRTGNIVRKICDDGYSISDGNQNYTCVGTSPGFSAWSPAVQATNCVAASCPTTPLSNSATASISGTTTTAVTISCLAGYGIGGVRGTTTISYTCTGTAIGASSWTPSPSAPSSSCQPVDCLAQTVPTSSSTNSTLIGKTTNNVTVTCQNGFAINGNASSTSQRFSCQGTAAGLSSWTPLPSAFSCRAVPCPATSVGLTTPSSLVGNTTAVVNVACGPGAAIGGGSSTTTSYSYTCAGSAPGVSSWSPNPLAVATSCQPVNCPTITPTNSLNSTLAGVTGSSRTIFCSNGFSIGGGSSTVSSQVFFCNGTAPGSNQWSPSPLATNSSCQPVFCPNISLSSGLASPMLLAGATGSSINVTCANGFSFGGATGGPSRQAFTCTPSGPAASSWSPNPSLLFCKAVSCPNTTLLNSSVSALVGVTQTTVSVTCSNGFAIDGGSSTTTSFSYTCAGVSPGVSEWTSLSRRCLPVNCPATLLVNTNASTTLLGVTGSAVTPVCANGFAIDGGNSTVTSQTYTCVGTVPGASAWLPNPSAKFCQAVNCTATNLAFTSGLSRLVGTTLTSLTASCAPGYSIGGGNSTVTMQSYSCLPTAAGVSSWFPNPAQVRCQAVRCPNVFVPLKIFSTNGTLVGSTRGADIVYCPQGYSIGGLRGGPMVQEYNCSATGPATSNWFPNPEVARCLPVPCPNITLSNTLNAPLSGRNISGVTGSEVNVTCANGFSMNATASIPNQVYRCLADSGANSAWSPNPQTTMCTALQCPTISRDPSKFSSGSVLTAATNSFAVSTCALGYTIGGFATNATTLRFNCTGTAPAANTWVPAPLAAQTDCQAVCGDGRRLSPEQCDDGNTNSGDGCSSTCRFEPGWACGTPNTPCIQCGIVIPPMNQSAVCETASASLSPWLAAVGGAIVTNRSQCLPASWGPPVLLRQSGPSPHCQTRTYQFNVSFAPGGWATAEADFVTRDVTLPTLSMQPADTTAQCNAIPSPANLTSTDSCDNAPVVTLSTSQLSGACADQYVLTRRWTARDACGNPFERSQTISVQDTNAPTFISSLANTSISCDLISAVEPSAVQAVDSCDPSPQVTFSQTNQTGVCPQQIVMRQQWVATDRCGNSARFVRNVAVFDSTAPAFVNLPASQLTVECNALPDATLTAVDACDPSPSVTTSQMRINGSCVSNYTLRRTWLATDACGNTRTFNQTLNVQDTTPPSLVGVPLDTMAECSAIPAAPTLSTTDACTPVAPVILSETRKSEGGCSFNYTLNRTWTAVDACGNRQSATQLIEIRDTAGPVFVTAPQNMSVSCDSDANMGQLNAWLANAGGAAAVDACSGSDITWTNNFSPSAFVSICGAAGYVDVTFTATDACGLQASKMARFSIMDTTAPSIVQPPQAQTIACDANSAQAYQTWLDSLGGLRVRDACQDRTVAQTYSAPQQPMSGCGGAGNWTVTFIATDACGNVRTVNSTFTVVDTQAPTLTSSAISRAVQCDGRGNSDDLESFLASRAQADAVDSCGSVTWSNNFRGLSRLCGNSVATNVTFSVVDECGNINTTTASFTVEDTLGPSITLRGVDGQLTEGGIPWTDLGVTVTDTCGGPLPPSSVQSFVPASLMRNNTALGLFTVHYVASDACGNTANVTRTVIVHDTLPPKFQMGPQATSTANRVLTVRRDAITSSGVVLPPSPEAWDLVSGDVSDLVVPNFDLSTLLNASTRARQRIPPISLSYTAFDRQGNSVTESVYVLRVLPAVNRTAAAQSLSWTAVFTATGTPGASAQPRQPTALLNVIFELQVSQAQAVAKVNSRLDPSSGLQIGDITCFDSSRVQVVFTTCELAVSATSDLAVLVNDFAANLREDPDVLTVSGPITSTGVQGYANVGTMLATHEAQALVEQTGATVQSSTYDSATGDIVTLSADEAAIAGSWIGTPLVETRSYATQLVFAYRVCLVTTSGACNNLVDLANDGFFFNVLVESFSVRKLSDIDCTQRRCTVFSTMARAKFDAALFALNRSNWFGIESVDGPFSSVGFNLTKTSGTWDRDSLCTRELLLMGVASTYASVMGPVCSVRTAYLSLSQLDLLQSNSNAFTLSTPVYVRNDEAVIPDRPSFWLAVQVPLVNHSRATLSARLQQLAITPEQYVCTIDSCRFVVSSLTVGQRLRLFASFPGVTVQTRTQEDELRSAMTSLLAERYSVDPSRLAFRFEGVARRSVGGSSAISMTLTISAPVTVNTQYSLSCMPPSSAATCILAQAALQSLGVSSSQCSVTGGLLNAVVWGDDSTLQSSVTSFCAGPASLSTLGTQSTAGELVQLLQQLESSGSLSISANGLVLAVQSASSEVGSERGASSPGKDDSGSGSMLYVYIGAGGGGGLLVLIAIAVIANRRGSRFATPSSTTLVSHGTLPQAPFLETAFGDSGDKPAGSAGRYLDVVAQDEPPTLPPPREQHDGALEAVYEALNFEPPKGDSFMPQLPGQMIMSEASFYDNSATGQPDGAALYDVATMSH